MYTHHRKLVVIDRSIAFVGGMDLANGRYDSPTYSLLDPDSQVFIGRSFFGTIFLF